MLNNIRNNKSFSSIINHIGRVFRFLPPNLITTLSLVVVFFSGYYYYLGFPYIGAIILAVSGFLDLVDGAVAKYTKRTTILGGFLDSTFDRIGDGIVLLGIGLSYNLALCFVIMIGAYLISYMRAKGESLGVKVMGMGIGERAERIMIIFLFSFINLEVGLYILLIVVYITVFTRFYYISKELKTKT